MNKLQIEKALNLIESFGMFLEKSGYQPSAARVYALLIIWDRESLHFNEIMDILKLSKGATSKALNILESLNRIEVFTKPGIRKKHYRVLLKPGKESSKKFLLYIKTMKTKLEEIETFKKSNNIGGLELENEINFFNKLIYILNEVL